MAQYLALLPGLVAPACNRRGSIGRREIRQARAWPVGSDKLNSEEDSKALRKSDYLIELRGLQWLPHCRRIARMSCRSPSPGSVNRGNTRTKSVVLRLTVRGFSVTEVITFLPLRSFQLSSSACLPCPTATSSTTVDTPVRSPKRFTITRQPSKLNTPRIAITDNTACITSSYSYATAQGLVKELASAVGMLAYTPEDVKEMLRELDQVTSEGQERDRRN